MSVQFKHVEPGEGVLYHVIGGDQITVKASGDDTDGAFAIIETVTPAQAGPPPHVHHREDETFYVLEGEFEFQVGETRIRAQRGGLVLAPRDTPHRFQSVGDTPGKLLVICQPAGFEKFAAEFATLPPDQPPDVAKMVALGKQYGIEFLLDGAD